MRAVGALPLVGNLPVANLRFALALIRGTRRALLEFRVRVFAWLRASQRWAARGPRAALPKRLAGCVQFALRPGVLRLFFGPGGGVRTPSHAGYGASLGEVPSSRVRAAPREAGVEARPVAVYASSSGNFFHQEMADLLARGLEASGRFAVERRDETREPAEHVREHIILAPHEFFSLAKGARFAGNAYRSFRRSSTLLLAEQPGTTHFVCCLPYAVEAKLVLDVSPGSALAQRRMGVNAAFFPLGYAPGIQALERSGAPLKVVSSSGVSLLAGRRDAGTLDRVGDRPIDVLFMGVATQRRAQFFARHAAFFASKRCFLSLPTPELPLDGSVPSTLGTSEATALSRSAKVLLNIHRDKRPYFEWHRIVIRGFWQRTLVVSEPCPLPPGIEAGVHLIEAELPEIPQVLRSLLETEQGLERAERIREAAFQALVGHYDMRVWARELAALYDRL